MQFFYFICHALSRLLSICYSAWNTDILYAGMLPEEEACGKSSFLQIWSFGTLHFPNPGLVSSVLMGVTLSGTHHQPVRLPGWRNKGNDKIWSVRKT